MRIQSTQCLKTICHKKPTNNSLSISEVILVLVIGMLSCSLMIMNYVVEVAVPSPYTVCSLPLSNVSGKGLYHTYTTLVAIQKAPGQCGS